MNGVTNLKSDSSEFAGTNLTKYHCIGSSQNSLDLFIADNI